MMKLGLDQYFLTNTDSLIFDLANTNTNFYIIPIPINKNNLTDTDYQIFNQTDTHYQILTDTNTDINYTDMVNINID